MSNKKPNAFGYKHIAAAYGRPYMTTWRHVQELMNSKPPRFVKRSPGNDFNYNEITELSKLMCFDWPIDGVSEPTGRFKTKL